MDRCEFDRWGLVDEARMNAEAHELLEAVGLSCRPDLLLKRLRSSEQQLVEIARGLSANAQILIMDEPTAALSRHEVDRLFAVIEELRGRNVAMMFVSHRMEEIYQIADRVAVLRDGHLVALDDAEAMSREHAVRLMAGKPVADMYPRTDNVFGEVVLEVQGLSRANAFKDVSFSIRAGEIVGFGGLVGSGRTDVARVLFGVDRPTSGAVRLDNVERRFDSPRDAMDAGIAYVSEDRIGQSLIMDFGVLTNASLPVIDQATRGAFVFRQRELALVDFGFEATPTSVSSL